MTFVRRYFDLVVGMLGAVGMVAAITILFGWVIALLLGSLALLALSLVVPSWD